eukprot:6196722-Pleurochrysis_carterae.AAC.3
MPKKQTAALQQLTVCQRARKPPPRRCGRDRVVVPAEPLRRRAAPSCTSAPRAAQRAPRSVRRCEYEQIRGVNE